MAVLTRSGQRQFDMLESIIVVLYAAKAVEPGPGDCVDLHTAFDGRWTETQLDHMETYCPSRCRACGRGIKTMVFRGTGYCCQECERAPF